MIDLKVEGMTCRHCVDAVAKALAAVPGVDEVCKVDLEKGTARVDGSADADALVAAVAAAGYRAELSR